MRHPKIHHIIEDKRRYRPLSSIAPSIPCHFCGVRQPDHDTMHVHLDRYHPGWAAKIMAALVPAVA